MSAIEQHRTQFSPTRIAPMTRNLLHLFTALALCGGIISGYLQLSQYFSVGEKIALGFLGAVLCVIATLSIPPALVPATRIWVRKAMITVVAITLLPSLLMMVELWLGFSYRQAWKSNNPSYTQQQRAIDILSAQKATAAALARAEGDRLILPSVKSPYFNTNSAGFRAAEFAPPKPDGTRVVILGGSTVFGAGVADDQTLPSQMQHLIDLRQAPVEIVNLGINGVTFTEEMRTLRATYDALKPDIAVFYHGGNDYFAVRALDAADGTASADAMIESNPLLAAGHLLAKETEIGRLFTRTLSPIFRRPQSKENHIRQIAERFLQHHAEAKALCNELRLQCRFFLQPLIGDKQPLGTIEQRILDDTRLAFPGFDDDYRHFASIVLAAAADINDVRDSLDGVEVSLFNDTIHLIGQGNRLMAQAILDRMEADLNLAPPPR